MTFDIGTYCVAVDHVSGDSVSLETSGIKVFVSHGKAEERPSRASCRSSYACATEPKGADRTRSIGFRKEHYRVDGRGGGGKAQGRYVPLSAAHEVNAAAVAA